MAVFLENSRTNSTISSTISFGVEYGLKRQIKNEHSSYFYCALNMSQHKNPPLTLINPLTIPCIHFSAFNHLLLTIKVKH